MTGTGGWKEAEASKYVLEAELAGLIDKERE